MSPLRYGVQSSNALSLYHPISLIQSKSYDISMKQVKITVKKIAHYQDLIDEYENPIEHACMMKLNQVFIVKDDKMPDGFCESAWETIHPFVTSLLNGKGNFYDGWMKNEYSAMISCNDGFRPVSFLLELIEA